MHVAFVGPAFLDGFFLPSMQALERAGHRATRYTDPAAFTADTEALATLDVLAALPNFPIGAGLMDKAPNLRALISPITGTEGFDEPEASARAILVANGHIEENYTSMGEAAVMLALAALYDLHGTERRLRENLPRPAHLTARTMMGKTVGIVGFGKIGQVVASRLQTWQVSLLASVRTPRPLPGYVSAVTLDELLDRSDVVIVAAALSDETRGMLSYDSLRRMKEDAVFVNVSRGGIAPDADVHRLAVERPRMRLALDVFDPEPLAPDSPLRDLPNAILTPHQAGHTFETHDRLPHVLAEAVADVIEGRVPRYVRNPGIADRWIARWAR